MQISSSDFDNKATIPSQYTCDGQDGSPAISWKDIPTGTKSLVLICDDPDAPNGDWVHWVLFNIPPAVDHLSARDKAPANAKDGQNSWGHNGYRGPCPPTGTHRYFFKLYALDAELDLAAGATKDQVLNAMQKHVLATAELVGLYSRQR